MLIDGGPEGCISTSWTPCEYFNSGCTCGKCNKKREDMDKEITAEWAREQANKVLGERVQQELDKCEKAIKNAVTRNEMTCSVILYAHDKTLLELRGRGFIVKQHDGYDQRDPAYVQISW